MKGLDTNVLVRFLVGDDRQQQARATKYLETFCTADEPGFVNRVVLAELVWVVDRTYGYSREATYAALEMLFGTAELEVEDVAAARRALQRFARGADFVDALIAETNEDRGCSHTASFDERAGAVLPQFERIP